MEGIQKCVSAVGILNADLADPLLANIMKSLEQKLTFGGYTKADLFGSYERRLSEHATVLLFAGGDNILNQKYFENGFRAPGVVGRGGISFRF